MANYIKRGESVFYQFRDGVTVPSAQGRPRTFKTARRATLGADYLDTDEIVEYAEVVRCKDCKHYHHYGRTSLLVDGQNIKAGWCQRRIRYDEEHRMLPDDFCSYGKRKGVI